MWERLIRPFDTIGRLSINSTLYCLRVRSLLGDSNFGCGEGAPCPEMALSCRPKAILSNPNGPVLSGNGLNLWQIVGQAIWTTPYKGTWSAHLLLWGQVEHSTLIQANFYQA